MKQDRLFHVTTTVLQKPFHTFQVPAKDIKQAITKADKIIKDIDPNAEITEIKAIVTALLDE